MDDTPARGRPRSETARRAVLDAALELCQSGGYQALTMKGIAETAGVGRQTVYRWWPAKQDVLIDALRDLALRKAEGLSPETGDTLRDVRTLLDATFTLTTALTGNALIGLMAEAQHDPALSHRLQATVIGPRRQALRALLARGVADGSLSDEAASLDLAVDFAFGTMWYRLISRHGVVDSALAGEITAALATLLHPGAAALSGPVSGAAGPPADRPAGSG
ncbi:TetR/AcrR family transcriptional regulator [Actinacidiphila bryophytorum]|uniref:TetR/AcrR family transcriptional regulator n=1 Tax=Actinacidiphila bryophytorum TaxID=1436133 RepID=UPI002176A56B|nr:TetR/AcrR family transcriptional regulator [Actinacidiphila bryophytorum]UWE11813.1 TetR/AcrR family transcriptional regulator [Actinacidiphila bryophytorum]